MSAPLASDDELYGSAIHAVRATMKSSISSLQKRLVIGYNRAARMVEAMEVDGIFGPLQSNASREIHKDRLGELAAVVTCDVTARCPTCRGEAGHVEAITA